MTHDLFSTRHRPGHRGTGILALRPMFAQRGQALLEVTLIMPAMVMMLVGAAELGRLAYAGIVVSNAARAGIQYGAQSRQVAADLSGMQTAALNDGQNVTAMTATASHYCVCADGTSSTCSSGDCSGSRLIEYVQVDTNANVQMLFHCPGLPASLSVKGKAIMRVVQ